MRRWVACLLALAGCIEPRLVECDDGTACPVGYTCSPGGCRSREQLAACAGKAEGEPCTLAVADGTCADGACVAARCGDGVVEGNELCDDGNRFSGDGCSGSCTSTEICGNGIVELDEQCDCGDPDHPGPQS